MSLVTKAPLVAAIVAILTLTNGCDSDGGTVSTSGSTESENTDNDSNAGTSDENATENTDEGTVVDIGNEPDTDAESNVDNPEYEAMYSARFVSTWSADTHPTNFPSNPHFSPLTGAVHSEQVVIWQLGQNASDGMEDMAETGGTGQLLSEIQSAIDEGHALSSIQGGGISLSPGATSVEFLINRDYPLVTLVSMLAPSPDWFVGVNSLSLLESNGDFVESITLDLNLYDSGTDGGDRFTSPDEDIPRSPIAPVNSFPFDTDFLDGQPSVGSLVITKTQ